MQKKRHDSILCEGFIEKINNRISKDGASVSLIRADDENEHVPKDLHNNVLKTLISIEPSPPYTPYSNGMAERLVQ